MSFIRELFGSKPSAPEAPPAAAKQSSPTGEIQGRTVVASPVTPAAAKAAALPLDGALVASPPISKAAPLQPKTSSMLASPPIKPAILRGALLSPRDKIQYEFTNFVRGPFTDPYTFVGFGMILARSRVSSREENMEKFNSDVLSLKARLEVSQFQYDNSPAIIGNPKVIEAKEQCRKFWDYIELIEASPEYFIPSELDTKILLWLINLDGLKDNKEAIAKELMKRLSAQTETHYLPESILSQIIIHGKPTKEELIKLIKNISPKDALSDLFIQMSFFGEGKPLTREEFSREFVAVLKQNPKWKEFSILHHIRSEVSYKKGYGSTKDFLALRLALFVYKDEEYVNELKQYASRVNSYEANAAKDVIANINNLKATDRFIEEVKNSNMQEDTKARIAYTNARPESLALLGLESLVKLNSLSGIELEEVKKAFIDKKEVLLIALDLRSVVMLKDYFDDKNAMLSRMEYLVNHTTNDDLARLLKSYEIGKTLYALSRKSTFSDAINEIIDLNQQQLQYLHFQERDAEIARQRAAGQR